MASGCPTCAGALTSIVTSDGALSVLACTRCGGLWLDAPTTKRLFDGVGERAAMAIASHLDRQASPPRGDGDPYRQAAQGGCPLCGEALARMRTDARHHPIAGIDLDVCATHGTWFDTRELQTIAVAITEKHARDDAEVAAFAWDHGSVLGNYPELAFASRVLQGVFGRGRSGRG